MSKVQFDFTGENFVVTGAGSGMGRQITIELAQAGAKVLALDLSEKAIVGLSKQYSTVTGVVVNVCDYSAVEQAVSDFVKTNGKLNGGVHAAGIMGLTPLRMYDEIFAKKIMDISFWAGVKFIQFCTKKKNVNDRASFVCFSSAGAHEAAKGMFAYAASKGALTIAMKSFVKELYPRNVRINTISPGWVTTPLTNNSLQSDNDREIVSKHLLGIGNPGDVSAFVLFLLSDGAGWITGSDYIIDGGYLA